MYVSPLLYAQLMQTNCWSRGLVQLALIGPRSFGSSGPTAWNVMPAHLRNPDLMLNDFRLYAENRSVPDCFGLVAARAFVTVFC